MKFKFVVSFLLLIVAGCSSEYSPGELEISSSSTFFERGTDSLINGKFVVKKRTGQSLEVNFERGLPYGEVEMCNADGEVIRRSNFANKKQKKLLSSDINFINEMLNGASEFRTKDYLDFFEGFAEYNGDYLEINQKNKKILGTYNNGKKIDRWQIYCENGQLESVENYKELRYGDNVIIRKVGKEQKFTCDGDVLFSANRDDDGLLDGKYIENYLSGGLTKPKKKFIRNYKSGKFDGIQKEFGNNGLVIKENLYRDGAENGLQKTYDQNGIISLVQNYNNSIKHGEERIYLSEQNDETKEISHWISEIKNYTNGKLEGNYQKFDNLERIVQSGIYKDGKPVGLWEINNYSINTKTLTDHNANNFILENSELFKDACYLSDDYTSKATWSKKINSPLKECEKYIEKGLVDINKKIALDQKDPFEQSSYWVYPAIVATPAVYDYMKSHGLNTRVTDAFGRTRLHVCISQFRSNDSNGVSCSVEQAISYMDDVDLNSVSNSGSVFHQLAKSHQNIEQKELVKLVDNEKKIAEALIEKGANINQLNHQKKTALMTAIENKNYYIADYLINAGASIEGEDSTGKNILGHFFLSSSNQLNNSKLSDDGTQTLAKIIALGARPDAVVLDNKNIQILSEENNMLFHIETLNNALKLSVGFSEELKKRPQIELEQNEKSEFIEAKKSLLSESNGSENTVDQVKLLDQPKEAVRSNVEHLLSEEAKNSKNVIEAENSDAVVELLKQQADFLVTQANEHIKNFRLKTPKNNNAFGSLEQLKKIDPENKNISIIEKKIGEKYLSLTTKKIQEGQKSAAQNHLNSASEFIKDESVLVDYQVKVAATKKITPLPSPLPAPNVRQTGTTRAPSVNQIPPLACDPVVSFSGLPLIGGQSFIAQQSLPISSGAALDKSAKAVRLTYNRVVVSGDKITYEQATSTKPIKFTLTVTPIGHYSEIRVKAKTPTGIVLKKSGYRRGFCDLLEKF